MSAEKIAIRIRLLNSLSTEVDNTDTQSRSDIVRNILYYGVEEIQENLLKVAIKLDSLNTKYNELEAANTDFSVAIEAQTVVFESLLDSEFSLFAKADDLMVHFRTLKEFLEKRENDLIASEAALLHTTDVLASQNRASLDPESSGKKASFSLPPQLSPKTEKNSIFDSKLL